MKPRQCKDMACTCSGITLFEFTRKIAFLAHRQCRQQCEAFILETVTTVYIHYPVTQFKRTHWNCLATLLTRPAFVAQKHGACYPFYIAICLIVKLRRVAGILWRLQFALETHHITNRQGIGFDRACKIEIRLATLSCAVW